LLRYKAICLVEVIGDGRREFGSVRMPGTKDIRFVQGGFKIAEAQAPAHQGSEESMNCVCSGDIVLIDSPGTSCLVVEAAKQTGSVMLASEPTPFGLWSPIGCRSISGF